VAYLGQSKVNDFDSRILILGFIQKVLRLQISVNDVLRVAIVECLQNLLEYRSSLALLKMLFLDDLVKQLASRAQLSNKIDILGLLEVLIQLQDMRVIKCL
jgi:hypothetical protein